MSLNNFNNSNSQVNNIVPRSERFGHEPCPNIEQPNGNPPVHAQENNRRPNVNNVRDASTMDLIIEFC